MSCCRSQYAKQNADIEEMLKEESKTNTREYKLLLLGENRKCFWFLVVFDSRNDDFFKVLEKVAKVR